MTLAASIGDAFEAVGLELKNLAANSGGTPNLYPITKYGALVDGATDDTAAVEAAIVAASAAGGGTVFFPAGTTRVLQIKLRSKVSLQGTGWGSIIKKSNTLNDAPLVTLNTEDEFQTQVKDLQLDGDYQGSSGSHGILLNNGATQTFDFDGLSDPWHVVDNVLIQRVKGHGVDIRLNTRETRVTRTTILEPGIHGISCYGTDNQFTNVVSAISGGGQNWGAGFYIDGANNRLNTCKAFWCSVDTAYGAGFYMDVNADRCTIIGCESQDNGGHGFLILGAEDVVMNGCISNANSGSNLRLDGAINIRIDGFMSTNYVGARYQTWYSASLVNNPTGSISMSSRSVGGGIEGSYGSLSKLEHFSEDAPDIVHGVVASSAGITVVEHGSNASAPRPAGAKIVWWIGSAAPSNAAINDVRVVT